MRIIFHPANITCNLRSNLLISGNISKLHTNEYICIYIGSVESKPMERYQDPFLNEGSSSAHSLDIFFPAYYQSSCGRHIVQVVEPLLVRILHAWTHYIHRCLRGKQHTYICMAGSNSTACCTMHLLILLPLFPCDHNIHSNFSIISFLHRMHISFYYSKARISSIICEF